MADAHALLRPPLILARQGAAAHVDPNTLDAFRLAFRLGAAGLALDAWRLTAGPVVVATAGVVRRGWRRRAVTDLDPAELPPNVVLLSEVASVFPEAVLLVFPADEATARATVAEMDGRGERLWLAADGLGVLESVRDESAGVKLFARDRLARLKGGPERHAATLAARRADGAVFPHVDWTGGLTALYHRFGLLTVATGAQHERVLREVVRMGLDAVVTDWPDRAVDAIAPADGA